MKDLFTSLTEDELDALGRFLLDRIEDHEYEDGRNEGVLVISELDGFFTAIVSGPVLIPPSQWFSAVMGEFEPVWENEKEFEAIFSLLMRFMNSIADMLMEQPEDFEPMFEERYVDGKTWLIVDEWCEGYMRGVGLEAQAWQVDSPDMKILLAPILAFTGQGQWSGHEVDDVERANLHNAIVTNVREIHACWLARREAVAKAGVLPQRVAVRVGRNEPCPCGSGKKYKKCCLH
ncbi:MAG: UPF0149 family protein [Gammaproteobacteria bacterium]